MGQLASHAVTVKTMTCSACALYSSGSQYTRPVPELDEWIRRRWACTKIKNLLALGERGLTLEAAGTQQAPRSGNLLLRVHATC